MRDVADTEIERVSSLPLRETRPVGEFASSGTMASSTSISELFLVDRDMAVVIELNRWEFLAVLSWLFLCLRSSEILRSSLTMKENWFVHVDVVVVNKICKLSAFCKPPS